LVYIEVKVCSVSLIRRSRCRVCAMASFSDRSAFCCCSRDPSRSGPIRIFFGYVDAGGCFPCFGLFQSA